MVDFHAVKETVVNASPEEVFAIVSDFSKHQELAGSGELVTVRILTQGATDVGTTIEADEAIDLGDQHMDITAKAVVVACSPPNTISWISVPPLPIRRIQWWFHLSPEGEGTKVVHECEVDLGEVAREMFGGTQGYNDTRGADVIAGMEKTMENLKGMV
jgi:hypothetical protein